MPETIQRGAEDTIPQGGKVVALFYAHAKANRNGNGRWGTWMIRVHCHPHNVNGFGPLHLLPHQLKMIGCRPLNIFRRFMTFRPSPSAFEYGGITFVSYSPASVSFSGTEGLGRFEWNTLLYKGKHTPKHLEFNHRHDGGTGKMAPAQVKSSLTPGTAKRCPLCGHLVEGASGVDHITWCKQRHAPKAGGKRAFR